MCHQRPWTWRIRPNVQSGWGQKDLFLWIVAKQGSFCSILWLYIRKTPNMWGEEHWGRSGKHFTHWVLQMLKKKKKKQCRLWNTCLCFRHSVQHCIFTLLQSRSKGLESMKFQRLLFFGTESTLKHKIRGIFLVIYLKSSLQRRPAKISFTFMKEHVISFSNSRKAREP